MIFSTEGLQIATLATRILKGTRYDWVEIPSEHLDLSLLKTSPKYGWQKNKKKYKKQFNQFFYILDISGRKIYVKKYIKDIQPKEHYVSSWLKDHYYIKEGLISSQSKKDLPEVWNTKYQNREQYALLREYYHQTSYHHVMLQIEAKNKRFLKRTTRLNRERFIKSFF